MRDRAAEIDILHPGGVDPTLQPHSIPSLLLSKLGISYCTSNPTHSPSSKSHYFSTQILQTFHNSLTTRDGRRRKLEDGTPRHNPSSATSPIHPNTSRNTKTRVRRSRDRLRSKSLPLTNPLKSSQNSPGPAHQKTHHTY